MISRAIFFFIFQPAICLNLFCFSKKTGDVDVESNFEQCSYVIVSDIGEISQEGVHIDSEAKSHYLKVAASSKKVKLLVDLTPKNRTIFPIGISANKSFMNEIKTDLRHLRSLNPLSGKPFFSGFYFRAAAFQQDAEYFGFFDLLSKLKEEKLRGNHPSFGEFGLEIDLDFNPFTIGFPTNKHISEFIEIFYLNTMPKELIKKISNGRTIKLNPLFVSESTAPELTLAYQKDMLEGLGIFRKTIVGFSTFAYEIMNNTGSLLRYNKLNTSTLCSILSSGSKTILYDRQSLTTSFVHQNSSIIFNMPFHNSMKEKIRWLSQNNFLGVGLDSFEADLDSGEICQYETKFPLHDSIKQIIETLDDEEKYRKQRALLSHMSPASCKQGSQRRLCFVRKIRRNLPPNLNGDIHPNFSFPVPTTVLESKKFYEITSETTEATNANLTDNESGIANFIEKIDEISCENLCGIADESFIRRDKEPFRTFGGEAVTENYYPWIVFVRVQVHCQPPRGGHLYNHCTGVLVSMNHVITAAHCLFFPSEMWKNCWGFSSYPLSGFVKVEADYIFIHFGAAEMDETKVERVRKVTIGRKFDMANEATLRTDDFAILELSKTLDRDADSVVPICLFNSKIMERMGEMSIVAGYGGLYADGFDYLNKSISHAFVPLKSTVYCNKTYNYYERWNYDPSKFVCAGTNNKGVIPGDCGGPLMVERNGLYYLLGLVMSSYNILPSFYRKYFPDVYTRMNSHETCVRLAHATNNQVKCHQEFITSSYLQKNCEQHFAQLLDSKFRKTCIFKDRQTGRCHVNIAPYDPHV